MTLLVRRTYDHARLEKPLVQFPNCNANPMDGYLRGRMGEFSTHSHKSTLRLTLNLLSYVPRSQSLPNPA